MDERATARLFIYLDKNAEFIYTLTCLEISGTGRNADNRMDERATARLFI